MKTWVRKSLSVGILAAAALLFAPGAAHADARQAAAGTTASVDKTAGPVGVDVYSPAAIPVSICGTSLANLGGTTATASCDTSAAARTESARTERRRVSPAVTGIPVTESATGGHGNGNDFCDNSLHFLGGGPSFNRFHGHRGHFHGGAFLGEGGFDSIGFYGDDLGDDLYPDDIDGPDDDNLSPGLGGQDVMPTKPVQGSGNGNGNNDGYGNAAPTTGNGNVAPTTGNGNVAPTTGNGNVAPTTGNGEIPPATGDVPPATGNGDIPPATGNGDIPPTTGDNAGYGNVSPTTGDNGGYVSPTKPTKPAVKPAAVKPIKPAVKPAAVKPIKPAVKPIKGNGDTTGYGAVSPATGSNTTTDGGR
jgi:hypothetical protein